MTFNVQGWHHPGLDHLEELLLEQAPRLASCDIPRDAAGAYRDDDLNKTEDA